MKPKTLDDLLEEADEAVERLAGEDLDAWALEDLKQKVFELIEETYYAGYDAAGEDQ